jgi:pyrroloquinoline quinone (PQQ) biosynthesis protein C
METASTVLMSLKRSARVVQENGSVVIRYRDEEITLEGKAAALFAKVLPRLDGATPLERIAEAIAEQPSRVKALADQLVRVGVIGVRSATDESKLMSGVDFHALHHGLCLGWLEPVYAHPLWEKITSGKASRAQVLGFAFEKYHYIEGAFEHMGVAAANATPEMMPHLARHFIEEYTHGDIYRKGLRSLFPDDVVIHSQPLPSTRALVNFLSESAGRSSFAYYAGNELLQMTENTGEDTAGRAVNEFYDAMRKHYPWTEKLINSFIAHTQADQKLGHEDAFLLMCKSVPPLTLREVNDALNVARSMAEHLLLFMDGIDVFYENFAAIPRLPCDMFSE